MEEIDCIIIESLRNLQCFIPDDVSSLKQFDPNLIINAIATCLEMIIPGIKYSHKLPSSMSLRLKLTTNIAEQIKELGFRGDIGYQSILYSNENEIRRVLMFLIERLPNKESNKNVIMVEGIGFVPRLMKEIEKKVKAALHTPWLPNSALFHGERDCNGFYLQQSFDSCCLRSQNIIIPNSQEIRDDYLRKYWVRSLQGVTKQCNQHSLLPSLLFKDIEFEHNYPFNFTTYVDGKKNQVEEICVNLESTVQSLNFIEKSNELSVSDKFLYEIESKNDEIIIFQDEIKNAIHRLEQLNNIKLEEETELIKLENKINVKTKTLTVLSKEENIVKLKELIEKGKQRLVDLAEEWKKLQNPYLVKYNTINNNILIQKNRIKGEVDKLHNLQKQNKHLIIDLKEKEQLEKTLLEKCEAFNKNTNRLAYTKKILEITANIKKQNGEIESILKDTKVVQKEINILNGQVDRSFTLSDELIFRDAKRDETARKAYKLLAALHHECGNIIKAITELGLLERESRSLQEQIDAEMAKETLYQLNRVTADLDQIRKEIGLLLKQ